MMITTTLYNIIQSELIKKGFNEIVDHEGNLIYFDNDKQFMKKIFSYDQDISDIVNDLFNGSTLEDEEIDLHFKRSFFYRFINRQINKQTIESFKFELLSTFLMNEQFINRVYSDMEDYLTQKQMGQQDDKKTNKQENTETNKQTNKETNKQNNRETNNQNSDSINTSDDRSGYADLPQSSVNLDVDNSVMTSASNNTVSRNKQKNNNKSNTEILGETEGTSQGDTEGTSQGITEGESEGKTTNENRSYQLDELFKTNGLLEEIFNIFDKKCFLQIW